MALGAGRSSMDAAVDYTSGIILKKKIGDKVEADETLAFAYSNSEELLSKMVMPPIRMPQFFCRGRFQTCPYRFGNPGCLRCIK